MDSLYSLPDWFLWLITVLALIISCALYFKERHNRFITLVDKIPGPKNVTFLETVLTYAVIPKEDWFSIGVKRMKMFSNSPMIRFWLMFNVRVFVTEAQAIEGILNSNKLIDKSPSYKYLQPWLGLGLLTSTGDKWRSRRKLITPSFHFRILDEFFKVFVEQTEVLVNTLAKLKDKDYFDIYPYLTRCTLDIICETAMGKSIQAQSDTSSEYVKAINDMGEIFSSRAMMPWLAYNWIFNLTSKGRLQKKSLKVLHDFTNQVIEERWAELKADHNKTKSSSPSEENRDYVGQKRKLAFLDTLLENFRDSQKLNVEDIREEVDTFMFEGHDTTSAGLAWILYNIGRYPDIQQKVHQELDVIFGNSKRLISKDDLPELKYLELVIKESLRLFPPVPFFGRQTVDDVDLYGYTIPAGVEISFFTYLIHRNEKYFPNPEKFDPNRFLPENCAKRHPFSYIPFSAGPRNCIGQKFAMMEMKTTVCQLLRNYKITSKHSIDEIKIKPQFVLRPLNGIWMKLENRP